MDDYSYLKDGGYGSWTDYTRAGYSAVPQYINRKVGRTLDQDAYEHLMLLQTNQKPTYRIVGQTPRGPSGPEDFGRKKEGLAGLNEGLSLTVDSITGRKNGDFTHDTKVDMLHGMGKVSAVGAAGAGGRFPAIAKGALSWGALSAALAATRGGTLDEVKETFKKGAKEGAVVSALPFSEWVNGWWKKAAVTAATYGAFDAAEKAAEGGSIGDVAITGGRGAGFSVGMDTLMELNSRFVPGKWKALLPTVAVALPFVDAWLSRPKQQPSNDQPPAPYVYKYSVIMDAIREGGGTDNNKYDLTLIDAVANQMDPADLKATVESWGDTGYERNPDIPDFSTEDTHRRQIGAIFRAKLNNNPSSVRQAAKAGDTKKERDLTRMAGFLATDKVPETLFGIPVVSTKENYTDADLAFFRNHPEAGGYYDLGDEDGEQEETGADGDQDMGPEESGTPEDGTEEGAPVQDDVPHKGKYYGNQVMYTGTGHSQEYLDRRSRVLDMAIPFIYSKEKLFTEPSEDVNKMLRLAYSTQYLYDPYAAGADRAGFRKVRSDDWTDKKGAKRASTSRARYLYDKALNDQPKLALLDDVRLARLMDRAYNGTPGMFLPANSPILAKVEATEEAMRKWADSEDGIMSYGTKVRGNDITEAERAKQEAALRQRVIEAREQIK